LQAREATEIELFARSGLHRWKAVRQNRIRKSRF
jgi:hypothetical protein